MFSMKDKCDHKYGKWEQYTENGTMTSIFFRGSRPYMEKRQRRHCEKCNYAQDEEITNS